MSRIFGYGLILLLSVTTVQHVLAQSITSWRETYGKSPAEFTLEEWRNVVDDAWSPTLSTVRQLALFDHWWRNVDRLFAVFQGLDFDIDDFRDQYRAEIERGVSRGRFAAIMSHFGYRLNDLHTFVYDTGVYGTRRRKGVPLLVVGQYGNNNGFGAVLTPLEDSTLVVYRVLPSHPLGLEIGDLVLGYDGRLWKDLYPRLIEAELPLVVNPVSAGDPEAKAHYLLQSAGLNWHLFDTLDAVKYSSGDTLHLPTQELLNERRTIYGSDHIDVPGVTWPDRRIGDRISSGIVDGTNVGYVYVTSWSFDPQFDLRERFRRAVVDLWFTQRVDGFIFDFRFNTGGGALAKEGLELLFNEVTATVGFDERADPADHFEMQPDPLRREANLVIRPDVTTFFDGPIAILIGPGAISAGELEARRMAFHPNARLFGLPAAGGNTGSIFPPFPENGWFGQLGTSSQYLVSTGEYIGRTGLQPDEQVWHSRESVANGVDAVVEAALQWIQRETTDTEELVEIPKDRLRFRVYPNPVATRATFEVETATTAPVSISVYDVLGRQALYTTTESLNPGIRRVVWEASDNSGIKLADGLYFVQAQIDDARVTRPIIVR